MQVRGCIGGLLVVRTGRKTLVVVPCVCGQLPTESGGSLIRCGIRTTTRLSSGCRVVHMWTTPESAQLAAVQGD
jgi:hypothetical protein